MAIRIFFETRGKCVAVHHDKDVTEHAFEAPAHLLPQSLLGWCSLSQKLLVSPEEGQADLAENAPVEGGCLVREDTFILFQDRIEFPVQVVFNRPV